MKHLLFFSFSLILSFSSLLGQDNTIDSIELSGLAFQIYLQNHTGIPIVAQQYSYVGIDPVSGDSLWGIERNALAGVGQKLSDDYNEAEDFVDIEQTPFIFVRNVLIDVRNGKLILPPSEGIKTYRGTRFLKDRNLLLIEVSTKGLIRLYGLDMKSGEKKFAVDLRNTSGLAQIAAGNQDADEKVIAPIVDDQGKMLYQSGKTLALINLENGQLMWTEKFNTAMAEVMDSGDKLLVIEKPTGLGLGSFSNTTGYGKMMHLLNYETGKAIWPKGLKMDGNVRFFQPYDGGLLVAHDNGLNILDYQASSKGRWKKDFKQGGIRKVEEEKDGLMVYFRAKRMLIDPNDGEEKWKKDEKVGRPKEDASTNLLHPFTFAGKPAGFETYTILKVGDTRIPFGRIALDESRKVVHTARISTERSDIKREQYGYLLSTYNIETGARIDLPIMVPYGIDAMEVNEKGELVCYNKSTLMIFGFNGTELYQEKTINYTKLQRKGAKTGKRIAKLLGGADDEDETVPTYLGVDLRLKADFEKDNFDPSTLGQMKNKQTAIIGYNENRLPFFSIIDKNTGEKGSQSAVVYDNSTFTINEDKGLVYMIHGPVIKWYRIE